jgi:hypothetical protein
MRRLVLLACAAATLSFGACGGDPAAAPTPTPVHTVPPGVIAPVDRARNTVDQLNQQTNRTEQQTGGNAYDVP